MKKLNCEILIIGGGLIGLVTAYSLALLGFKIIIVEKTSNRKISKIDKSSFKDTRTTAISEGSRQFLKKINLWKSINSCAQQIKFINVFDRKLTSKINFYNQNSSQNLGYIVKNNLIIEKFLTKFKTLKNIKYYDGLPLEKIIYKEESIVGVFNNISIFSKLIIAADGKKSFIRNITNTKFYYKEYSEKAIVVNFAHERNHNSTAYEIFLKSGPLALLPMKEKFSHNYSSSLIWSHNKNFIDNYLASSEKNFISILEEQLYPITGSIKKIYTRQAFQLSSHINSKFYSKKIIFIGDAAHSIHPIAGQGWNLGLRDVTKLYKISKNFKKLGLEVGSQNFCKKYHDDCFYDAYRFYNITDKLNNLFMQDAQIINSLRGIGFEFIERNNFLKKNISNFAMGL